MSNPSCPLCNGTTSVHAAAHHDVNEATATCDRTSTCGYSWELNDVTPGLTTPVA